MTSLLSFGSKLSLVLCLLLLPRVGLAAELVPRSSGLPGTAEPAPLRLSEDSPATRSERAHPSVGLRLLAEVGVGMGMGLGLGLVGSLAGAGLCATGVFGPQGDYFPCFGAAGIGALVGIGVGLPLGVFWGGKANGGDGALLGSVLGMASGVGASVVLSMMVGNITPAHFLLIPFVVGCTLLGYELSGTGMLAPQAPGAAPAVASTRLRFQPVLALSERGMLVGLGGSF